MCVLGPAALIAAAACLSATAGPSSGPDVIVGDLPEVVQFTQPADDPQAYAVGTLSCNIGDDLLAWVDYNSHHPVIAQNMYRLWSPAPGVTRFDQIGQSWLKHAFLALSGTYCDFCPPGSPMGSVLGVGCSDPYGAFLNGQQSAMGPRSEVNAATGVFPFPISWGAFPDITGDGVGDQPPYNGVVARRIRVARADLTTAGARYFVEGQYVAQDDTAAGNSGNNASYRRVTVNPSTLEVVPADITQRGVPAIYAWRDHGLGAGVPDPAVTITPIDLPGDGRFLVGSRVTQTGPSTWRYEYALQNLDSERAAYAFGVSVGAGPGAYTNAGFHDTDAHSGEVWDTTDWARPVAGPTGGVLTWHAVQTAAANPRGNALRWGTLYNLWLDSDRPPTSGQLTIVPFSDSASPPNVSAVRIAGPTPGGAAAPVPPFNDNCADSVPIGRNDFAFSTAYATDVGPDECAGPGSSGAIVRDVWFRYTHDGLAGTMTVSTCGSTFDTKIAVYAGGACPGAPGAALACNDDAPGDNPAGCGPGSLASLVSVEVAPGQTYLIRVGGSPKAAAGAQSGNGVLTLTPPPLPTGACCRADGSCTRSRPSACNAAYSGDGTVCLPNPCPQPVPPANDYCFQALWIADGVPVTSTNANANTDGSTPPCANGGARDVWYKYRPAVSGDVRITTDNSVPVGGSPGGSTDFDTALGVFSACGGQLLDCDDDAGVSPEPSSDIQAVALDAGHTYLIRVAGYPYSDITRQTGVFTLKVIGGGGVVPVSGACCVPDGCFVAEEPDCVNGSFAGADTACGDIDNPIACCPANFNRADGVSVQDIFDFLSAYFSGDSAADFNRDHTVSVQDIFDFLIAYFRAC